jgi:protein TonB
MAIQELAPPPPIAEEAGRTDQRADIAAKPQPKCEPATVIAAPPVPTMQPPAATPEEAQPEVDPAVSLAAIISTDPSDGPPTGASARAAALARAAAQRLSPLRMRIAGVGILVTALLVGGWQRWRAITPPKSAPMNTQLTQSQPAANAPAPLLAMKTKTAPAKSNAAPAQPKPAEQAPAITLAPPLANTSSAAPPVITLFARPASEASPISNLLSAPVAAPKLEAPIVSQTSGGKLIKKVDPTFPPSMTRSMHGEVVLKATINRKGQVAKVSIVRGQAVLAQAAVAAVTQWRYEPFLLNGVPIEAEADIVVNFKAPGQ